MKIVLFNQHEKFPGLDEAVARFPGVEFVRPADLDRLAQAVPGAEILITANRTYTPDTAAVIRKHGTALRWIQFSTSGTDKARASGLPSGLVVTNAAGMRAFAVAEHAIALTLALMRRLRQTEAARREQFWSRDVLSPSLDNLSGKHLLIVGLGAIGQEIARKAKAFDMAVTGISRSAGPLPHVDRVRPRGELVAACGEADIVVLAATSDESTHKILGREAIAALKSTAVVVNIARGALVDEPALISALEAKRIAGAGLDVMVTEPIPAGHPFWALDNVVMTPHVAGAGAATPAGGFARIFADNLRLWIDGKPLKQVVIARTP